MRPIVPVGARIGFADRDTLAKGETIGIAITPPLLGHVPIAIEDAPARQFRPEPAQIQKHIVIIEDAGQRVRVANRRRPDGRARRLERSRPQVHMGVLVEPAIERKDILRRPRLLDQRAIFAKARPRLDRRHALILIGVVTEGDREARDQTAAADLVEHRVFFGYSQRLLALAERATDAGERDIELFGLGRVGERRQLQIGVRQHVIGCLPMLGRGQTVKSKPRRQHHFVKEIDVVAMHILTRDQRVIGRGDDGIVPACKIIRQLPVGKLLESQNLHECLLRPGSE